MTITHQILTDAEGKPVAAQIEGLDSVEMFRRVRERLDGKREIKEGA